MPEKAETERQSELKSFFSLRVLDHLSGGLLHDLKLNFSLLLSESPVVLYTLFL